MDHITATINRATPAQQERARAIARDFAALSGLQPHTCPDGYRMALFNIVDNDEHPVVRTNARESWIPVRCVALNAEDELEIADALNLLDWAAGFPPSVNKLRIVEASTGVSRIVARGPFIAGLMQYTQRCAH